MSTIDMTQVAGIQAVNAEGKVIGTLSVDDLTELVAANIVQSTKKELVSAQSAAVLAETSTLAATDEYEDQLALDTNPAYIRSLDTNGNPKRTAIASLATVVGGLIGEATIYKKGLMPSYRVMSTVYSEGNPVKYSIPGNTGFSFIISVYKNHENQGAANILISGYSGGLLATALRKNGWLGGISYISKGEEGIDIYVKVQPYVYVSAACLGTSSGKFITSSNIVSEVPSDAVEVSF